MRSWHCLQTIDAFCRFDTHNRSSVRVYALSFTFFHIALRKYTRMHVFGINHTKDNPEDPQELSRAGCLLSSKKFTHA